MTEEVKMKSMSASCFLLLLLLVISSLRNLEAGVLDDPKLDPDYERNVNETVQKWKDNFKRMKKLMGTAIKTAMPYFMNSAMSEDFVVSPRCKRALYQWIADLRSMKTYALRMADASAKMVDGILTGTLSAYGSYDQCVETIAPQKNITGQYCTIEAWPPLPPKPRFYALNERLEAFKSFENDTGMMGEYTKHLQLFYIFPFRIGICVPSACSREDIYNVSQMVTKTVFPANITVPRCEVKEVPTFRNYQIPILCVISILIILVIYGTITEILLNRSRIDSNKPTNERGYGTRCVLSFSVISNWKMLMDLEAGSDDLSVLHGIRFFSMCWIIFGHTYFHLSFNVLKYLQMTIDLFSQLAFNSVTNATLLVDNFFFLSGLLFIYMAMDITKKIGKVPNPFYIAVHRIWRFLPIQMFFVGFAMLLPLFGDGPLWHENIDPVVEGCKQDWWANFIFINNIYRSSPKGCLSYTWYLAADFQVYILCIPIVLLVMKKPKLGLFVNLCVMILSVVGVGIHNYIRELPPGILFTRADTEQRNALMMETYYFPLHHLGPHCLGLFVGYYLRLKKSPKQMHRILHWIAWIVAFTMTTSALFGVHPWNVGAGGTGVVATVLYASLSRMSWTLGLAWITIACTTGCGGFLTSILKWKPFIPLSRLTFMVYMVHPLVQYVFYATLRDGIQARNVLAVFIYFGFLVSSYAIAFIACLFLEAPLIKLGKIIFDIEENIRRKKLTLRTLFTGKMETFKEPFEQKPVTLPRIANGCSNGDLSPDKHNVYTLDGRTFICRL